MFDKYDPLRKWDFSKRTLSQPLSLYEAEQKIKDLTAL